MAKFTFWITFSGRLWLRLDGTALGTATPAIAPFFDLRSGAFEKNGEWDSALEAE
jgi:hypothetical protein